MNTFEEMFERLSGDFRKSVRDAAPDMVRVLLAVEWKGYAARGEDGGYDCCPACAGVRPGQDDNPAAAHDVFFGYNDLGHYPSCTLDAALKKAGVR